MGNRFYQTPEVDVDELVAEGCLCTSGGGDSPYVPDTTEGITDGGEKPW